MSAPEGGKRLPLRARLEGGPLVFDGAMGTELYRRGQFIHQSFDGINLTNPELVESVHRDYLDAGAEVIETNTFASNRRRLRKVGLEERHDEIHRAAVAIARRAAGERAYVVGSVGPSGERWDRLDAAGRADAVEDVVAQARVLLAAGVDGLVLETFPTLAECTAVLLALRPLTEAVIFAQLSFLRHAATEDGASPEEAVVALKEAGADVVGVNCADGPSELFALAERMVGQGVPVSVLPNAGYPKKVDGRMIYMATPEYFGVYARRFLKLGVAIIGGCCGTTPEHIRSMSSAARMQGGGAAVERVEVRSARPPAAERREAIPFAERSRFAAKLASSEGFAVSVEVNPPTGLDAGRAVEAARMLQAAGVDVINIADGPRASVRMSNWALALEVRQQLGMESLVHFCMRDRNLLGLQSDLLAFHALGLHNLVIVTGDPPKMGDYPNATAVYDLDSIGCIGLVSGLNAGLDPAGRSMEGQTRFAVACGAEPASLDYDRELRRLEQKVAAGASFIMTQPVYDPSVLDRFLTDTAGFGIPVLLGLMPLASHRNAEFIHNEIPGMQVPSAIRQRMQRVDKGPIARAEGVRIAQEALLAARDRVRGAYIMPALGRYEAAIEILEAIGYERPEAYREGWRS
jgi:homocysteine S-methyltransferase